MMCVWKTVPRTRIRIPGRKSFSCAFFVLVAGLTGCAHMDLPVEMRAQSPEPFWFEEEDSPRPLTLDGQPAKIPTQFRGEQEPSIAVRSDETVTDIRVRGNVTIPASSILRKVNARQGNNVATVEQLLTEDVKSLYNTRWFYTVDYTYERGENGLMLVFTVVERPIIRHVEYRGNKKIKTKHLAGLTNLQRGGAYSVSANKESVRRIREHYRREGYLYTEVKLLSGGSPDDRDIIFEITEGPKVVVSKIRFEGNDAFSSQLLKTKLLTKARMFWFFGGQYDPSTIPDDIAAIKQYYHDLGYFDVQVAETLQQTEDRSQVIITYNVQEGPRYKIRNIEFQGTEIYTPEQLQKDFETEEGEKFALRHLNKDIEGIKQKYGEQGRLFAKVNAYPRFLEQEGEVDLVFRIDEDRPRRIGRINVNIQGDAPNTRETVVLNQLLFAPGELADPDLIRLSRSRLRRSPIWEGQAVRIDLEPVDGPAYAYTPPATDVMRGQGWDGYDINEVFEETTRHISGDASNEGTTRIETLGHILPNRESTPTTQSRTDHHILPVQGSPVDPGLHRLESFLHEEIEDDHQQETTSTEYPENSNGTDVTQLLNDETRPTQAAPIEVIPIAYLKDSVDYHFNQAGDTVIRAQSYDATGQFPNPVFNNSPQGDIFSDQLRNPEPPGFVDVNVNVAEARTGRLMFSVGVNSDNGVIGSIVLEEQNFDLFAFPTSFSDITQGRAFRGRGQQFRLEAVPGDEVSRYVINWTDPFFLDTDYSLGVSGFFYTRFFEDWEERRLGGRITLGKRITREISVNGAVRLENVDISNIRNVSPQDLIDVEGDNFLTSARLGVAYDTRDSAYFPSEGEFLEISGEQALAEDQFTKVEGSASKYFTVFSRPDGEGRHIFTMRGQVGWTTDDTPIFERFYAGGFQTFRGFQFRGVSPEELNVKVGGNWMLLGTMEYNLPVTVNENVRLVAFSDFGTVDEDVALDKFRVSVGGGVRLTIPAMGPVPISLDWAIPLSKEDEDDQRIFQFYIGFTR